MIGCLIGEVLALEAPTVLLNVNGVGYEIDTPLTTFCQLQKGQKITLWTHLAVREDAQLLYGFINAQEKNHFPYLIKGERRWSENGAWYSFHFKCGNADPHR